MDKRLLRRCLVAIVGLVVVGAGVVGGTNANVIFSTRDQILSVRQAATLEADCVVVLGAGIMSNTVPSPILARRLDTGIELYRQGAAPVLLLSGDNSSPTYSEVHAMEAYSLAAGVPVGDIYRDHAGFSTYDSMYRLREVFGARKVIIVTQRYHLSRAIYIAQHLGLEAYGVAAAPINDSKQPIRDLREIPARLKDALAVLVDAKPAFLGDPIALIPGGGPPYED